LQNSFDLGESEYVTALEVVELESSETASGFKLFIAVGTSFMRSEELTVRGRVSLKTFLICNGVSHPDENRS
jgi:cleavage and polyadenylation specificity factor subunit 1